MIVHTCGVVVVTREKGQHPSCFFWPLEASAVLAPRLTDRFVKPAIYVPVPVERIMPFLFFQKIKTKDYFHS